MTYISYLTIFVNSFWGFFPHLFWSMFILYERIDYFNSVRACVYSSMPKSTVCTISPLLYISINSSIVTHFASIASPSGNVSSSIFISLVGILGGVFMPLSGLSKGFLTFVNILPFAHSVSIASDLQTLGAKAIYPHVLYLLLYTFIFVAISIALFLSPFIRPSSRPSFWFFR